MMQSLRSGSDGGSLESLAGELVVGLHVQILESRGLDVEFGGADLGDRDVLPEEQLPEAHRHPVHHQAQQQPLQVRRQEDILPLQPLQAHHQQHHHRHQHHPRRTQPADPGERGIGVVGVGGLEDELQVCLALLAAHGGPEAAQVLGEGCGEALLVAEEVAPAGRETAFVGEALLAAAARVAQLLRKLLRVVRHLVLPTRLPQYSAHLLQTTPNHS